MFGVGGCCGSSRTTSGPGAFGGVRDTRRTSAGYKRQRAAGREQPAREEERSPGLGVGIARGERAARPCAGRHVAHGDGGTGRLRVGRWNGRVTRADLWGCDRTSVFDGGSARAGLICLGIAQAGKVAGVRGCRGPRGTYRAGRRRSRRPGRRRGPASRIAVISRPLAIPPLGTFTDEFRTFSGRPESGGKRRRRASRPLCKGSWLCTGRVLSRG